MSQDVIWDYFQNEGIAAFGGALPRLEFLVRQLRAGDRVLNIGVGSGDLEVLATRKGVEVWALDPNERAIEQLRQRLGLRDRAQAGYSQELPFKNDSFDAVIMTEVLEHLDAGVREKSLSEALRVLKPGGRFIGTVPARERLQDSEVVCPKCEHHFHRWGHQASFDLSAMDALLRALFRVEALEERYFNEWESANWNRRALGLVKKLLSWRDLGPYGTARHIFFVARKT